MRGCKLMDKVKLATVFSGIGAVEQAFEKLVRNTK